MDRSGLHYILCSYPMNTVSCDPNLACLFSFLYNCKFLGINVCRYGLHYKDWSFTRTKRVNEYTSLDCPGIPQFSHTTGLLFTYVVMAYIIAWTNQKGYSSEESLFTRKNSLLRLLSFASSKGMNIMVKIMFLCISGVLLPFYMFSTFISLEAASEIWL